MTGPQLILLDERSRPPLRLRVGALLTGADEAAFAVARIRLGVLDLTDDELDGLRRCRVLLSQLDASMLLETAELPTGAYGGPGSGATGPLGRLHRFVTSGRLEVRSVGLGAWRPDFAIVSRGSIRTGIVGSILFGNPELILGPTLTVVTTDQGIAGRLAARFDEIWERSHDVLPAIREVLERGCRLERADATRRGPADPGEPVRR